jgi:Tfp pilus assembly protein FimT
MASPRTSILNHPAQTGFTLLEVLIVIGLLIFLTGLTALMSLDSYRGYSFRGQRDNVISVLQKARGQAMNNVCLGSTPTCSGGRPHGVHFSTDEYIIFQGASLDDTPENASHDQVISADYPLIFTPAAPEAVFKQLSGDATAPLNFTVSDEFGHSSDITINSEGRISWSN